MLAADVAEPVSGCLAHLLVLSLADELLEHLVHAPVVVDGERDGRRLNNPFRAWRFDEAEYVIQTLLVAGAAEPVDGIIAVFVFAFEVVNLGARNVAALRVVQEEEAEVARLDGDAVNLTPEDGRPAEAVHAPAELFEVGVDGDARAHIEGVGHPEGRGLLARAPCTDGRVQLRLQVSAGDRDEVLSLGRGSGLRAAGLDGAT